MTIRLYIYVYVYIYELFSCHKTCEKAPLKLAKNSNRFIQIMHYPSISGTPKQFRNLLPAAHVVEGSRGVGQKSPLQPPSIQITLVEPRNQKSLIASEAVGYKLAMSIHSSQHLWEAPLPGRF